MGKKGETEEYVFKSIQNAYPTRNPVFLGSNWYGLAKVLETAEVCSQPKIQPTADFCDVLFVGCAF